MAHEQDPSFGPESPVGQYWLLHCAGFRVEGSRRRSWIVESVSRSVDGGDLLHVRREGRLGRAAVIPAVRVASIHPWDETIVLRGRSRRGREQVRRAGSLARAQATGFGRRLAPHARTGARAAAKAARRGAILLLGVLAAAWALLVALAAYIRRHTPGARRRVASAAKTTAALAGVLGSETRRVVQTQSRALAARVAARREQRIDSAAAPLARDDGASPAGENGAVPSDEHEHEHERVRRSG